MQQLREELQRTRDEAKAARVEAAMAHLEAKQARAGTSRAATTAPAARGAESGSKGALGGQYMENVLKVARSRSFERRRRKASPERKAKASTQDNFTGAPDNDERVRAEEQLEHPPAIEPLD